MHRSFAPWLYGVLLQAFLIVSVALGQDSLFIREHYLKAEYLVPMRDGVKLFTAVYSPVDTLHAYPFLLNRTPYGVAPYGSGVYKTSLGPSADFSRDGFIFVYQDVRGRKMSEGSFVDVRPERDIKRKPDEIDESTDTYDTIAWLVTHIRHNNGNVGMWGISYPGFYAAAGMIGAHPALKAVSPQAPIADWFAGDDFHHNGALFLMDAFGFYSSFGKPRPLPTTASAPGVRYGTPDGYKFYLNLGPLPNANRIWLKDSIAFWNDLMHHGTYDNFWNARCILPHVRNIKPAVLVVGGLFDAEDLYGPLSIFATLEKESPATTATLVLGPWRHGGWERTQGDRLGDIRFGANTSEEFQTEVLFPFFAHYLKGKETAVLPRARVFETGVNRWREYDQWPPRSVVQRSLYMQDRGRLSFSPPDTSDGYDEYVSDPSKPVPYSSDFGIGRNTTYMIEDQRFAGSRPDVMVYETDPLAHPVTLAGPIVADLFVSTSGSDADYVTKVIDVYPDSTSDVTVDPPGKPMGGYEMLVRWEVMRGKFRNSLARPEPMVSGKVTEVKFGLRDVSHTFLPGHRIMVQIQNSCFPLVDRNPQKYLDIYGARESDFQKATHRIYHGANRASRVVLPVLGNVR